MTDDQMWRIIAGGALFGTYAAFRPQFDRFFYKLGYRKGPSETGWKRGLKVAGFALALVALMLAL